MSRSKGVGNCVRCGAPKPPGRLKYCGDDCWQAVVAERDRARQAKRRAACRRCGGEKGSTRRGGRYCKECRRVVADSFALIEAERGRRRYIKKMKEREASGERIARRNLDAPDGHKWCARCQDFRPHSSFSDRSSGRLASYCKPCTKSYNAERRLMIKFGLDWDEYEMLLACQDYRCAICRRKPRTHLLSVDHCHQTGEIRGLLCSRCNHKLLGSANDDAQRLREAADYLEAFTPREVFGEPKIVPGHEDGAA